MLGDLPKDPDGELHFGWAEHSLGISDVRKSPQYLWILVKKFLTIFLIRPSSSQAIHLIYLQIVIASFQYL
jgi:hypothetical protein